MTKIRVEMRHSGLRRLGRQEATAPIAIIPGYIEILNTREADVTEISPFPSRTDTSKMSILGCNTGTQRGS